MNVLAVMRMSFLAQRLWLVLGAVVGVLLLVLPWIPGVAPRDLQGMREALLFGASITAWCASLVQGFQLLTPELKEDRLGFFFSLPLTSTELLIGKLLGAWGVSFTVLLGALLPNAIAFGLAPGTQAPIILGILATTTLGCAALMLAGHALSLQRSGKVAWSLVDLATLSLWMGSLWLMREWTSAVQASELFTRLMVGAGGLALLLLLASTMVQLHHGKTDLARNHRTFSMTMAAASALLLIPSLGVLQRYTHPGVEALAWTDLGQLSPQGEWMLATGGTPRFKDVRFNYLVHLPTGRLIAAGPGDVQINAQGTRALRYQHEGSMAMADLRAAAPTFQPCPVECLPKNSQPSHLSPEGRILVWAEAGNLCIADLDAHLPVLRVAAPTLQPSSLREIHFDSEDQFRVFSFTEPRQWMLHRVDRVRQTITTLATWEGSNSGVRLNADATRFLVWSSPEHQKVQIRDAHTGSVLGTLSPSDPEALQPGTFAAPRWASDGTLVMVGRTDAAAFAVFRFTADGTPLARVALSSDLQGHPRLVGLVDPRQLWVREASRNRHQDWRVDLTTGTARPFQAPARIPWWWLGGCSERATRLGLNAEGQLVWEAPGQPSRTLLHQKSQPSSPAPN